MRRSTLLRAGILLASVAFAAVAFVLTDSRKGNETTVRSSKPEASAGVTSRDGTAEIQLGAAAYFPQGTNPPIGSQLEGVTTNSKSITVEGAKWEDDTVIAFGVFRDGTPECALTSAPDGSRIPAIFNTRTAGDAFLFTARPTAEPEASSGPYYVRCALAGSGGEHTDLPHDEKSVKGSPSSD